MRERASRITGQLPSHEMQIGEDFVAVLTDERGKRTQTAIKVAPGNGSYPVTIGGRTRRVTFANALRDIAVAGDIDGQAFTAQIERIGLHYRIIHNGAQIEARVLSKRAAELEAMMPFKAPPDLSKFLLSPMPGLLVDVSVRPGQKVLAGERLAVIEAMKMENILVAQQDRVVARVAANKGDSLAVDQVILEFE
jgi:propionyl-CoA carboxylase alpha chain